MYKALSIRCQRCTKKKKNKKKIVLRFMAIGAFAVQFLHYIPLYRNTQHCATLNCSVKRFYAPKAHKINHFNLHKRHMQLVHLPITIQPSVIIFLFFFFFVHRWYLTDRALYVWTAHASIAIRCYYTKSRKSQWPEVFAKCQVRWAIITAISTFSDGIRVYAWKLVSAPKSHKIEYVPMHTIREITRLATMLAGLIAPRIRLGFVSTSSRLCLSYALASISCEYCRSSRNNPHYVPSHIIYYYLDKRNFFAQN